MGVFASKRLPRGGVGYWDVLGYSQLGPAENPLCHPAPPAACGVTVSLLALAAPQKTFACKEGLGVSEHKLLKSPLSIYFGGIFPTSGFAASSTVGLAGDIGLAAASWGEVGPATQPRAFGVTSSQG